MGRLICFLLFLLAALQSAQAQFQWGINAGPNVANRGGASSQANRPLFTTQFAVFARDPLSDRVCLEPSLGYQGKGVKFRNVSTLDDLGNQVGTGDECNLFNYLQFTIPFQWRVNANEDCQLYTGAGVYAAYLLSARSRLRDFHGSEQVDAGPVAIPVDRLRRVDGGLFLSVSALIRERWEIAIASSTGLANSGIRNSTFGNVKNQSLGITLGYLFR